MKKYKTEMLKLILIAFITPVLVMLYTVIEKAVAGVRSDNTAQTQAKPASPVKEENAKTPGNSDYILAKNK